MKDKALVSGFARSFISGNPISNATITVLENRQLRFQTDLAGKFGPFEWSIGEPITLVFEKPGTFWSGYKTTQTPTIIVPPDGINNSNFLNNISFQVPSNMAYKFFSLAMGVKEDVKASQITATITPPNTTLDDIPQGIAGVSVTLSPEIKTKPFYFGIFPVIHKTNPFSKNLNVTSLDGGVAFTNVPPGDYIMEAKKDNITFSKVMFKARPGILVNASPPQGPTMIDNLDQNQLPSRQKKFSFFKNKLVEINNKEANEISKKI
ncbi:carboxypeptidase regulatory-like domain-containing protein [Legionella sp. CNM-1927-20]|uniref:carboxypeptidase regulatory-like domain-containing protein n=1 Tax=Legionella sp. CNM-1927-20 TaxID=3422221 RepID=UPI00403ADB37